MHFLFCLGIVVFISFDIFDMAAQQNIGRRKVHAPNIGTSTLKGRELTVALQTRALHISGNFNGIGQG